MSTVEQETRTIKRHYCPKELTWNIGGPGDYGWLGHYRVRINSPHAQLVEFGVGIVLCPDHVQQFQLMLQTVKEVEAGRGVYVCS